MRERWTRVIGVLLAVPALALVAACSGVDGGDDEGGDTQDEQSSGADSTDENGENSGDGGDGENGGDGDGGPDGSGDAAAGDPIGDEGSACSLPVQFTMVEGYEPSAIEDPEDPTFEQGGFFPVCELDAKPAGNLGYIRVWLPPTDEPGEQAGISQAVEVFVEDSTGEVTDIDYEDVDLGGEPGVEAIFTTHSETLDETRDGRVLGVGTSRGVVLIELGGLDQEEHEEMLPAYELARDTLEVRD